MVFFTVFLHGVWHNTRDWYLFQTPTTRKKWKSNSPVDRTELWTVKLIRVVYSKATKFGICKAVHESTESNTQTGTMHFITKTIEERSAINQVLTPIHILLVLLNEWQQHFSCEDTKIVYTRGGGLRVEADWIDFIELCCFVILGLFCLFYFIDLWSYEVRFH